MERIPRPGEFYRHFKNKLYQVLAVAEHTETGELLVIYQALYGNFKIYARPLSLFTGEVDRKKYPDAGQQYRFERVEPEEEKNTRRQREKEGRDSLEKKREEETPEENREFLMEFLDAESLEEKLAVVKKKGGQATSQQLEMICEVLEIPAGQAGRAAALEAIRGYLETRIKYDGSRLRR